MVVWLFEGRNVVKIQENFCKIEKFAYLCIRIPENRCTQKGAIAQLVEQRTENPCVTGSIPVGTTNQAVGLISDCFLYTAKTVGAAEKQKSIFPTSLTITVVIISATSYFRFYSGAKGKNGYPNLQITKF